MSPEQLAQIEARHKAVADLRIRIGGQDEDQRHGRHGWKYYGCSLLVGGSVLESIWHCELDPLPSERELGEGESLDEWRSEMSDEHWESAGDLAAWRFLNSAQADVAALIAEVKRLREELEARS